MSTPTIPEHDQPTHDLARALADALTDVDGNPWEYAPPTEDRDWTATAYIECGNQRLAIRVGGWRNEGRAEIHGDYPRDPITRADVAHDYRIPNDVPADPKMTATTSKAPDRIAREIARRILPDYRHRLAAALELLRRDEAGAENRDRLAEQVAEWSAGRVIGARDDRRNTDEASVRTATGDDVRIGAHGGFVRLDRLSISLDTPEGRARAERVLRALAD